MAKLKLKLKKSIDEKLSLVEHVNVDNAEYIATGNGFDVFDIRTFDAMQTFKVGETDTGCNFTNGRNEFDSHITNGTIHLYLFVQEDTYKCYGAAISGQNNTTIKYNNSQSTLVCNICFEDIEGHGNNVPDGVYVPLYLIPGVTIEPHFNTVDSQELLDGIATISNTEAPEHTEPVEPAEEPEAAEEPEVEVEDDPVVVDEPEEGEEEPENVEEAPAEEPVVEPAPSERSPFKYKVVGKEVYITHIKITPEMRQDHRIEIPEVLDGKPVTKLWKNCLYLDTDTYWYIKFPQSVNEIKNYAILTVSRVSRVILDSFTGKKYTNSIYFVGD